MKRRQFTQAAAGFAAATFAPFGIVPAEIA